MNSELCRLALAKVGNPNVLVNLVSKRVRQLNATGNASRPMVDETTGLGLADIALKEIVEEKMAFDMPLSTEALVEAAPKKRKKSS